MKTFIRKSRTIFRKCLLWLCLLPATLAFASKKDNNHSSDCLDVAARMVSSDANKSNLEYNVQLFCYDSLVNTFSVSPAFGFHLNLKENQHYILVISRPGYLSKQVSISTQMNNYSLGGKMDHFFFEVELDEESKADKISYVPDFPIAFIEFNNKKKCFEYNKKYQANIKKESPQNKAFAIL